ncbi:hypothetical protein AX777_01180 [Sphingobium yanoikuyae]|uniref:Uncharacterized protein n=1 Tax=Sphingobium yanoikuyae TaxID=13690 RepID=A0A177JZJ2_SPHYA|nr:hypothetical protein AX777_01180 [Sphingobium yanoikuyae]
MVDQQISLEVAKFLGPRRLLLLILRRETVGIADAGPYLALADIAAQRLRLPIGDPALRAIAPLDRRSNRISILMPE